MHSNPIKWHGGKSYLAKRIIDLIPPHLHYVEPYFGGGAVLFAKPLEMVEGHSEVVNDINGELMNFWRVLQGDSTFEEFSRIVSCVPFAQSEWEYSQAGIAAYFGGSSADTELQQVVPAVGFLSVTANLVREGGVTSQLCPGIELGEV